MRRRLLNLLTALSLLLFVAVAVLWLLNSGGSSSGEAALARAEGVLGGRLWEVATDARAAWTARDFHGDSQQYFSFSIPVAEVADFEASLRARWEGRPLYRGPDQVKEVPYGSDAPAWMAEPLPEGVFYEYGTDTVGISRKTGRVLVSRIET